MDSKLVHLATADDAVPNGHPGTEARVWAARITECWRSSVEGIIRTGRLLLDAKADLLHGEFGAMCARDLPFSDRTAQRLMAIAEDKRLSNPTHVSLLPASWGTLYELTKLSDDEFTEAVQQHVIRPDMLRGEAELIRPLTQRQPILESSSAAERFAVNEDVAGSKPASPAIIIENLPRDEAGRLTPEAKKALSPVIKEVRAEKQIEKKERREERELEFGKRILALPDEKSGVALEDFEWDHEPWSRETGMDRSPANHYETAADAHTPEEIVARTSDRFKCLADDCVLYMWTTIPHEAIAHKVLELRGFKYVTQRVWGKLRKGEARGTGYWLTGEHEILLIAVRGNIVPPATAVFRSFFVSPVREHSEKPDEQYEHAEYHFPNVPKIEFNARRGRVGWKAYGHGAPIGQADLKAGAAA